LDIKVSFSLWLLNCAREAEPHNAVSFLGMTILAPLPLVTTFEKNFVLTPLGINPEISALRTAPVF
jgi:hypothetical protein